MAMIPRSFLPSKLSPASHTWLAIFTLVSGLVSGGAPSSASTIEKLEFLHRPAVRRIGPFTELSDKQILNLRQDKSGFIWIATVFELYRYDGVEFKDYTSKFNLPENHLDKLVSDLEVDAAGNLWIAGSADLFRYNPRRDEIQRMEGVGPTTKIVTGPDGHLLVFSREGRLKLFRFQDEKLIEKAVLFQPEQLEQDTAFGSAAFNKDGNAWLVCREGQIFPLKIGERKVTVSEALPMKLKPARSFDFVECVMHDEKLWIGGDPGGLFRVDFTNEQVSRYDKRGKNKRFILGGNRIDWIQKDRDGDLWVGLKDGGMKLYLPEAENFSGLTFAKGHLREEGRLAPSSAEFDNKGNIWIGTRDVGLFTIDSKQDFLLYENLSAKGFDYSTSNIIGILETQNHNLWVSIRNIGLGRRKPSGQFDMGTSKSSSPIQSAYLEEDGEGRIWANTKQGLFTINPLNNQIKAIPLENTQDKAPGPLLVVDEGIWTAFGNRLLLLNTKTKEIIDEVKSMSGAIRYLYKDPIGRLWIGGRKQLHVYDSKTREVIESKWEHLSAEHNFQERRVTGVKMLEDGSIWLSIFGKGMMLLDPNFEVKTVYEAQDGMPSEAIEAFQIDNEGILWLGTRFGLISLDPSTNQINQYLEKDGLIDNRFAPGDCQKTQDGSILFKTAKGLLRVQPQNRPKIPEALSARLTDVKVLGADVAIEQEGTPLNEAILFAKELTLSKKQGVLTLSYSANSYKNLGQTWFRWRLLNDKNGTWSQPSLARTTTLSHLHPGTYNWELQASLEQHHWNGPTRRLKITVHPSLWTRWWAVSSIAIVAFGIIILIVYAYNRHQIRRSRRLEKLIEERTKEIAGKNSELEEKTEELTSTATTLSSTLHQLQEMQAQLVETARTAGKAEIATNVLHSVGNVLNSLNVGVSVLSTRTQNSHATKLSRLAEIIQEHQEDIAVFMSSDPRGKNVPNYLIHLSQSLEKEMIRTMEELSSMKEDIDHIKSVIAHQQTHAKSRNIVEQINIRNLCESALKIIVDDRSANPIKIINEIPTNLIVENDKHRLLDILLNLMSNGIDAINERDPKNGILTLRSQPQLDQEEIEINITDNGSGIAPKNREKLFRHGFTTKTKGHGFGLHSCANAAKRLGGQLTLDSPGLGHGATATLTLPRTLRK